MEAARARLRTHLDNPSQVEKCDLDKWWLALPIGANKTILPEPTQSTESLTVVTCAAKIFEGRKKNEIESETFYDGNQNLSEKARVKTSQAGHGKK